VGTVTDLALALLKIARISRCRGASCRGRTNASEKVVGGDGNDVFSEQDRRREDQAGKKRLKVGGGGDRWRRNDDFSLRVMRNAQFVREIILKT